MRTQAHGEAALDADAGIIVGALAGCQLPLQLAELRAHSDQRLRQQQRPRSDPDDAHWLPQIFMSCSSMSRTTDITRALAP